MDDLIWLTVVLFLVAAVLRSELFFYLLYVIVGLQVLARLWVGRSARNIRWLRRAPPAAFPGDPLTVELEVQNKGILPMPWLSLHESVPSALRNPPSIREVLSLGAGEQRVLSYTLIGQQRGFYKLGPLSLRTGDVLGFGERSFSAEGNSGITIYPPVVALPELGLPATLPYGTLAARQRLFSDPARPSGVRPYQAADGVRRIDWKSTAHAGQPQVRRYQPAIALETMVALAFGRDEYTGRYVHDTMERALVAAASIAAHLVERGQPVGLCASGRDPLGSGDAVQVPIGQGRTHLMQVLGALGRLQTVPHGDLLPLLHGASHLGWGSTLVLITGQRGPDLVVALLPFKQRGVNVALVITEPLPDDLTLPRRHGMAAYGLWRDGRPRLD